MLLFSLLLLTFVFGCVLLLNLCVLEPEGFAFLVSGDGNYVASTLFVL